MELINVFDSINKELAKDMIVCIGEFDGVHIAHRMLIKRTVELARLNNCKAAIISFYPHPDYVIGLRVDKGYLTTEEEKNNIFSHMGIDYSFVVNFSKELSKYSYVEFYEKYLSGFKGLVCGYDFRFGYKGEGNSLYLKEKYEIFDVIEKLEFMGKKIGSNEIREYLDRGNIELANTLLGRLYNIKGVVKEGSKLGRTIGFPTANIDIDNNKYSPKVGVYSVMTHIDGRTYIGICNIGNNPTFNTIDYNRLEVNLFDFDGDLYNRELNILFLDFIRDEKKFDSVEELKMELERNKQYTIMKFGGNL